MGIDVFSSRITLLYALLAVCSARISAQSYCEVNGAFTTSSQPQTIDTFTVVTDTVKNFYGDTFHVKLKFARPLNDNLPFERRPLVIGLHGGGFISDYSGSPAATTAYIDVADQLKGLIAPLGFITASLDYRTGYGIGAEQIIGGLINNPASQICAFVNQDIMAQVKLATYNAAADCRSAVDYIFQNPALFPFVDTSQIYLFGASAGAITALHAAFSERENFYAQPPDTLPPFAPKHKLGGLVSYSGALTSDIGAATLNIEAEESIPLMLVHGTLDAVVPAGEGTIGNCTGIFPEPTSFGDVAIAQRACELNIPHELFLIEGAGHDLGGAAPVALTLALESVRFIHDFGICPTAITVLHSTYSLQGQLIRSGDCTNTGDGFADEKVGFLIYPNPAGELLYFTIQSELKQANLEIYDCTGRLVKAVSCSSSVAEIADLLPGIYMARVSSLETGMSRIFVKE